MLYNSSTAATSRATTHLLLTYFIALVSLEVHHVVVVPYRSLEEQMPRVLEHQQSGDDERHVGKGHDAPEAPQRQRCALVALCYLHGGEEHRPYEEDY